MPRTRSSARAVPADKTAIFVNTASYYSGDGGDLMDAISSHMDLSTSDKQREGSFMSHIQHYENDNVSFVRAYSYGRSSTMGIWGAFQKHAYDGVVLPVNLDSLVKADGDAETPTITPDGGWVGRGMRQNLHQMLRTAATTKPNGHRATRKGPMPVLVVGVYNTDAALEHITIELLETMIHTKRDNENTNIKAFSKLNIHVVLWKSGDAHSATLTEGLDWLSAHTLPTGKVPAKGADTPAPTEVTSGDGDKLEQVDIAALAPGNEPPTTTTRGTPRAVAGKVASLLSKLGWGGSGGGGMTASTPAAPSK